MFLFEYISIVIHARIPISSFFLELEGSGLIGRLGRYCRCYVIASD
jgi:hypothetical protein